MIKRSRTRIASRAVSAPIEELERRTLLATGPTATLYAGPMDTWGPTYTFKVAYQSDKRVKSATVDDKDITVLGPNGYSRTAKLVSVVDNVKIVTARYKVSTPGGVWDAFDNGTYTVVVNNRQVRDQLVRWVPGGVIGTFQVNVPTYPSDLGNRSKGALGAVNVASFNAIPNDGIDDYSQIQAAIDSLPRNGGVVDGKVPIGGTVWLPAGIYDLSHPIQIYSGVTLRGVGGSTILRNTSNDQNSAVIYLASPYGHGYVMRASVQDLVINSNAAAGIVAKLTNGDITSLTLSGLTISTGGPAIDLRVQDVYQSLIRNVTIKDPGSTALWMVIGKTNGNSALNRVENFKVEGAARSGFRAEKAMVVLGGDVAVERMTIGNTGAVVTPLSVSSALATFSGLSLQAASSTLPGGVLIDVSRARVEFDQIIGLAANRRLASRTESSVHVGSADVGAGASLAQALSVDPDSHVAVDALRADGGIGSTDPLKIAVGKTVATLPLAGTTPPTPRDTGPVSPVIVDAESLGARGYDFLDDTAAIQAAIDRLPLGNGLPNAPGSGNVGGLVTLPAGKLFINGTLRIPSGVWLRGHAAGTLLYCTAPAGAAAITLVSGAAAGYNVGAGVSDLMIVTTQAAGIRADASLTNGVVDLQLLNLLVSAGGVGIDLHQAKIFHARLEYIAARDSGSVALWFGDDPGYSTDNTITGLSVTGTYRSGYQAGPAQVIIRGQTTLTSSQLEPASSVNVLPLLVSGAINMQGLWAEYNPSSLPGSVMVSLENVYDAKIDRLWLFDDQHRLRLRNSTNVEVGYFDINGRVCQLDQALDLDGVSTLKVGTVNSRFDAGMLDDPRVSVAFVRNNTAKNYVQTSLLTDPSAPNYVENIGNWQVIWGDHLGSVFGGANIDYSNGKPRLIINVISNPNNRPVTVLIRLQVPDGATFDGALVAWRVDGPAAPIMYTKNYAKQYPTRVLNSRTAALMPVPLLPWEDLIVQLAPINYGSYVLSDVAVVPIGISYTGKSGGGPQPDNNPKPGLPL